MDRLTGVVMEKTGSHVILLTPKGEFKRVRITGRMPDIGEEIRIPVAHRRFIKFSRVGWAAVAAAVILLMVAGPLLTIMNQPQVAAASVWVENPGIELTVSRGNNIMDVRTTNSDGAKVLARTGDLKGSSYYNAVAEITKASMKLGLIRGSGDLLISYALMPDAGIDRASFEKTLTASVNSVLGDEKIDVAAIHVPSDLKEKAGRKGLTPAKYAVLVEAVNAGLPVTEKDIQEKGIVEAISSAGGQPDQIIKQASKEDQFEAKERKYLAIASRNPANPTVSIASSGSGETGPTGAPPLTGAGDNPKPEKNRKLIEPIRKGGSPEDRRSDTGNGTGIGGARPGQAGEPAVTAPDGGSSRDDGGKADNNPGNTGNNTGDSGSNPGSSGTNTDDNYMGPAQPDGGTGNTNEDMYKLKPNF